MGDDITEEFEVKAKRIGIAAIAALTLIGSTAAMSSSADARPYNRHHGGWHRGGVGLAVGAGLLGGLAVAGAYPYASGRCWVERRPVYDAYGYRHWRRVQICN
ncbi:MAG: hypothetical protein JWN71_3361 [Xanthobacteraceae bacterium]|jgi:hypothetical protein|nr:hypothetical protein [Xanthobacteraceae bacterium]